MGACLEEQKCQFPVVLLPYHQPVRLDVALPLPFVVALQQVGMVLLLVETLGGFKPVLHRAMPSS